MNIQLANFSTDLRRISDWIIEEDFATAEKFLKICKEKYALIPKHIGVYENIWDEITKIEQMKEDKVKAAERASTASVILLNQALN